MLSTIEEDVDPHAKLNHVEIFHDFDSIPVLNAWARRQRKELNYYIFNFTCRIISHLLEYIALFFVFFPKANNVDSLYSISLYFISLVATSLIYFFMKPGDWKRRSPFPLTKNDCNQFFGKITMTFKPFRLVLSLLHHRSQKLEIIGKEFIHGETVTRNQLNSVLEINKQELIAARDDVYDAFLLGIPMALLQFHILVNTNTNEEYFCSMKEVWQAFLILLYIMSAVKYSVNYEWKKQLYLNSLHVREYVMTNGRYSVPELEERRGAYFFIGLCHMLSICSRFFLITFVGGIHGGLGIVCFVLLLSSNWLLVVVITPILCNVENLPEGITLPAVNFVDRWICTFTAKETRFFELCRSVFQYCQLNFRFPLVFTQVLTFIIPYTILYSFVSLYKNKLKSIPIITSGNCSEVDDSQLAMTILHVFESTATFFSPTVKIRLRSTDEFLRGQELHWLCFYFQIVVTVIYNYLYCRDIVAKKDRYPIEIACKFLRLIFLKVEEKVSPNPSEGENKNMIKRLLFLTSLDLRNFLKIYNTFQGLGFDPNDTDRWWEGRMRQELDRNYSFRVRGRNRITNSGPTLEGSPLQGELERMGRLTQSDQLGLRLYMHCVHRLDHVLLHEVTSYRIVNMLEMFSIPVKDAYIQVESQVRI